MTIFVWGAKVYFAQYRPPQHAMEVYVVGKQWMWKFQHTTGQREINELHVPAGRKVKLIMATEDVIHDLFVPAFRTKMDVVPEITNPLFEAPNRAVITLLGRFLRMIIRACAGTLIRSPQISTSG